MAASIESEYVWPRDENAATKLKDHPKLHHDAAGRSTPLPQYEKSQSVPFTLTLQEEKDNPGQFQLVVNVNSDQTTGEPTASAKPQTKLVTNVQSLPSLGYNVSPLYRTQKSSPPETPQVDRPEWSDLDAIPQEFLQKVVPDWPVNFTRTASSASSQSKRLADIKARIKKSGKGFVVRLLKGSSSDTSEVADVHLEHGSKEGVMQDGSSSPPAELDSTEVSGHPAVEIGTSGEPGIQRPQQPQSPIIHPSLQRILSANTSRPRHSISEDSAWNSDTDTLTQEIRPFGEQWDATPTDLEPLSSNASSMPTRTHSTLSIMRTPTRGLSVVGPVHRVPRKKQKTRAKLDRSDAHKSFKRRSPRDLTWASGTPVNPARTPYDRNAVEAVSPPEESNTWHHPNQEIHFRGSKVKRNNSLQEPIRSDNPRTRLTLQTTLPRPNSTGSSPVTRRSKSSPRSHRATGSSTSVHFADDPVDRAPIWSEVDSDQELREAVKRIFSDSKDKKQDIQDDVQDAMGIPTIAEPIDMDEIGNIPLEPELELRPAPTAFGNPAAVFLSLALDALSSKGFDILHNLRARYGSEPPVAPNHVRVRWTCSCGEQLYDDFIENRRGAARLLEAYLNRPRTHTPSSPISRSSTESTMSSVFSSLSKSSTLATPASTYGGSLRGSGNNSKSSPTSMRSNKSFNVLIGGYAEEQWLLTCANEGRFTPKIVHLDVNSGRIKSDKDLALALREHYDQLNRKWFRMFKLRGLSTIEFVQFEVHRNRFADIRASPSMPHHKDSYAFEPVDLMPPVGSTYLLHLFKHPSDYDNELITYLRAPKRRQRLDFGLGWGINMVEDFLAERVWALIIAVFGLGSAVFAIAWVVWVRDVQGAFGVASWAVGLSTLIVGGIQASLG